MTEFLAWFILFNIYLRKRDEFLSKKRFCVVDNFKVSSHRNSYNLIITTVVLDVRRISQSEPCLSTLPSKKDHMSTKNSKAIESEFLEKKKPKKQTNSSVLFPEIQKELEEYRCFIV
jgi:hypothetical protein